MLFELDENEIPEEEWSDNEYDFDEQEENEDDEYDSEGYEDEDEETDDEDAPDPYKVLEAKLATGSSGVPTKDHPAIAFEIYEQAELYRVDVDDLEAVWRFWLTWLQPVYSRVVSSKHDPKRVIDTMSVTIQILEAAGCQGIPSAIGAWEYFAKRGTVSYSVVNGARKFTVLFESRNEQKQASPSPVPPLNKQQRQGGGNVKRG